MGLTAIKPIKEIVVVLGLTKGADGKILLTIRRESKLKEVHLKFQLPGGKPKDGETLEKTAIRELKEETGFIVKVNRKLPLIFNQDWDYGEYLQKTTIHCFECNIVRQSKLKRKMHQDVYWYHPKDLDVSNLLPGTIEFINLI